ncbi:helix-turn-helix transcriptional regulator [Actinokineospora terrae]|uniref:Helix-turn-helix domain-containing protein n=1 Tax=Actinokineospora terrae TaxID=155974 RepID=A0A1H9XHR4_9PSEU|nr:helix-turn-helix transcriptional regulator [Actinokineospora terrae]SES45695.1 Helix-turn-helix domain-containing protein [Actinokineospora terrae]
MATTDLGGFLRSRRQRLTPAAAGITPGTTHRRVPGLRREELAGVSVGYYTRLEQGTSGNASAAVIDALATALRLDPAEHDHLRVLATPTRPTRPHPGTSTPRPSVRHLLTTLATTPAVVIDHRADVLAWNPLGHALLAGHLHPDAPDHPTRPNLARMLFLDADHRALYRDWHAKAHVTVAALHQAAARHPNDPRLHHLIDNLTADSHEFAHLWARRPIRTCSHHLRELDHPVIGRLTLANETLTLPDDDQRIGLFHAHPGTPDADALTRMARTLDRASTR